MAPPLQADALLISSVVCIIIPFLLPIGDSFQASYSLLNVWAAAGVLGWLALSHGCPSPLAFIFFPTAASMMAWWPSCMVFLQASICVGLPAQLNGPPKPNSTFLALWYGSLSIPGVPTKEQDGLPWRHGPQLQLSGLLARPAGVYWWSNILPTHGTVEVNFLLLSPSITLTWIQQCLLSLGVGEQSHQCWEDNQNLWWQSTTSP